jgi:hypothetical protein
VTCDWQDFATVSIGKFLISLKSIMLDLDIPPDVLQQCLPSQNLNILDFIAFNLPSVASAKTIKGIYISTEQATACSDEIGMLLSMPVPSLPSVKDLVLCLRSALPTAQSVAVENRLSKTVKHFPLWIITYWNEINHIAKHKQQWLQADKTLQQLHTGGEGMQEVVDAVYEMLNDLSWFGSMQGFTEGDDIIHLHRFIGTKWLGTVQEDQMLDLLRLDISRHSPDLTGYTVQATDFIPSLIQAFRRRKVSHRVPLHVLGESLATGVKKCVGTIMNCQGTHWAAVVLDFGSHTIWHGDSLGWKMEKTAREAAEWWIRAHTSVPFTHKKLPIAHQDDQFSCGLFAWNALAHYYFPAQNPLLDLSESHIAGARLRVLLRICTHHLNQVH